MTAATIADNVQVDSVAASAWNEFRRFAGEPGIVTESMPILYFGDSVRYLASECRMVTAGLNPSRTEFPERHRNARFASIPNLPTDCPSNVSLAQYRQALDAYFRTYPYRWFTCFRTVLAGLGASYNESQPNGALHTDLCSPLATDPTWSGLSPQVQLSLQAEGTRLWHSLIAALRPHVVIISVKDSYLSLISFPPLDDWQVLLKSETKKDGSSRRRPYTVMVRRVTVTADHPTLVVFAPAAQTPLGPASTDLQMRIGQLIRERL